MAQMLWKKYIWYCSKFKRLTSSLFVPLSWAKGNTVGSNPNWWDQCIRSTLYLKPGTQAIRNWLQGEGQEGTRTEIWLGPNRTQEPIIYSASHNLGNPIPRYGRTCKCSHPCKPAFHQTSPESSIWNSPDHQNHLRCFGKSRILGSQSGWFSLSKVCDSAIASIVYKCLQVMGWPARSENILPEAIPTQVCSLNWNIFGFLSSNTYQISIKAHIFQADVILNSTS